jgi:hypothetical protein
VPGVLVAVAAGWEAGTRGRLLVVSRRCMGTSCCRRPCPSHMPGRRVPGQSCRRTAQRSWWHRQRRTGRRRSPCGVGEGFTSGVSDGLMGLPGCALCLVPAASKAMPGQARSHPCNINQQRLKHPRQQCNKPITIHVTALSLAEDTARASAALTVWLRTRALGLSQRTQHCTRCCDTQLSQGYCWR